MKKVENTLFETADGQRFHTKNYAQLHARTLKVQKIKEINAAPAANVSDDVDTDDADNQDLIDQSAPLKDAKEIIEFAKSTEDADALVIYLEAENGRKKPRTTVVAAIELRLNELNAD